MSQSSAPQTITQAITQDHNELREYHSKYKSAASKKEKEEWANQFRWELARHSAGEELILYPAFEKHLKEEGKRMASQDRAEHQIAKEDLYKLEKLQPDHAEFETLFHKLASELEEHMKGEERDDLPKFEAVISREESMELAKKFALTKNFVPTRAHPSVSDKGGLFETAAGLAAAPLDKLKDLFDRFPARSEL